LSRPGIELSAVVMCLLWSDIPTAAVLHVSQWTALDCTHSFYCSDLFIWFVAQSSFLQQRELLCLF